MGVYDGHHIRIQGDVKQVLDPTLNKQVLCLRGSVSAANFIDLPGPGATQKERTRNPAAAKVTTLGLTGEYMYIQLRAMADRFFSIHIDVLTTQGLTIRLSISNIFKYIKVRTRTKEEGGTQQQHTEKSNFVGFVCSFVYPHC